MTEATKLLEALSNVADLTNYKKASGNADGSSYTFSDGSKLIIEVTN